MKKAYLLLLFVTLPVISFPQKFTDSLDFILNKNEPGFLYTRYYKQLNIHYLNSALRYNLYKDKFAFNISETFNSTLVKSHDKNLRDENYFLFKGGYDVSPFIMPGLYASSNILSDDRKIEINQASVSNAALYINLKPAQNIFITPFMGYTNNRQIGQNDYGMLYGLETLSDDYIIGNTRINGDFKFRNEDIIPRRNLLRNFALLVTNQFEENVSNNIGIKYYQSRRDFYYLADDLIRNSYNIINNIQSRTETGYLAEEHFYYDQFLSLFQLDFTGRINQRSIDRETRYKPAEVTNSSAFDTRINELKIDIESAVSYHSDIFSGLFRINYSERDEKHVTKNFNSTPSLFYTERSKLDFMKNNNSVFASISFAGNVNISKYDRLLFSLYQNKLRYDTPSSENYDDRDELLSMVRLRYTRTLTPFFESFVNVEGTLNHTVYIFSQNSSNNNINRVLRLSSGGSYSGKNVSSLNMFEVSSNYTVYDFEDINPNYRSFSFRQFTALDSSTVSISRKFFFSFYGYLKLSEQGELKWAAFSTRPTRYLREIYTEPKLNYIFSEFLFSAGIKLFKLDTYSYLKEIKVPESRYTSIGPIGEINYTAEKLLLRFYLWYEFITGKDVPNKEQTNLSFQTNWYF